MAIESSPRNSRAERVYAGAYFCDAEQFAHPDPKIITGPSRSGLKILSVGSGSGSDLWQLAASNEVHALDNSPSAVEVARAHGLRAQVVDLERPLQFEDSTFDLVVAKDLLEHLLEPARLLAEVRRVLKPGGQLVLSVPNHFYLPFRVRILFGGNLIWKSLVFDHTKYYEEWDYMHLRFFTWRGLQKMLTAGGFRIEKSFWDFGLLAHYLNPDMIRDHLREKYVARPLTAKARFFMYGIYPAWRLFNLFFPRRWRHFIVGLAPGLLCAGYYLHCEKQEQV